MSSEPNSQSATSRMTPSWRQRIDDALSSLKVAPPDVDTRDDHEERIAPAKR